MNKIALIQTFCKVALHHTFTGAAKSLNISVAAVSKQIQQLEDQLGVVLFERTTRKVTLTVIGESYYKEVQRVLLALEEADSVMAATKAHPSGLLRVKSPRFFAEKIILPRMPLFQNKYPDVVLDLQIAEEVPNLWDEELDIVFGMSMAVASNSVQKKIGMTRYVFCAAPAYLEKFGYPKTPYDLANHHYLTHSMRKPNNSWVFGNGEIVHLKPRLYLNDAAAIANCACLGLGVAALHVYQVKDALQRGELVEILPDDRMADIPVFLYYHPARYMQPKISLWIDAIISDMPSLM